MELRSLAGPAGLPAFAFVVLAVYLQAHPEPWRSDLQAYEWADATGAGAGPWLEAVTVLGSSLLLSAVVFAASMYGLRKGHRRFSVALFVAWTAGQAAVYAIKFLVDRPRPVAEGGGSSTTAFPSGHAANVAIAVILLAPFVRAMPAARRRYVLAAAVLLVFVVGLTRVLLVEHWPTDVLGGWLFAAAYGTVAGRMVWARDAPMPLLGRTIAAEPPNL